MIRVLLADDSLEMCEVLRTLLEADGRFTVVGEANDGERAVSLAAQEQPDFVLLDYDMPVMNGLQALPQIRRQSPHSRVVMLTGFGSQLELEKLARLGGEALFDKGSTLGDLVEKLARMHEDQARVIDLRGRESKVVDLGTGDVVWPRPRP